MVTLVNSHIPQDQASVHYSSFDASLKLISKCGKGCWLAKSDLENAFRNIPMDFNSLQCLGLKLNKMFYVDTCMPFGAASACAIFETFATFLEWAIEIKARHQLAHYLDNFFFCRKTKQECQSMLNTFTQTCQFINFPISQEKTEGPSQTLTYLGLGINTVKMIIFIPPDKLAEAMQWFTTVIHSKKVTIRQLQCLSGLLNFLTKAIRPSRAFIRRIYNKLKNLPPHYHMSVDKQTKLDCHMWLKFLHQKSTLLANPNLQAAKQQRSPTFHWHYSQTWAGIWVLLPRQMDLQCLACKIY